MGMASSFIRGVSTANFEIVSNAINITSDGTHYARRRPGLPDVNTVTIERQVVKLRDVKLTTFVGKPQDAIGYIQLQGFTQDAGNEVRASITALQKVAEKESSTKKVRVCELRESSLSF